jgi:hypothetical protein
MAVLALAKGGWFGAFSFCSSSRTIPITLETLLMKRIAGITLSLLSMAAVAAFAADSTKVDGYVSDAMCGAKHAGTGAACAKKCLAGGEKPVFVDSAKKEVWTIDNPDSVKEAWGKHVALTVTEDASAKSVHVTSVSVLGD